MLEKVSQSHRQLIGAQWVHTRPGPVVFLLQWEKSAWVDIRVGLSGARVWIKRKTNWLLVNCAHFKINYAQMNNLTVVLHLKNKARDILENKVYCSVFSEEKTHFHQCDRQPGPPAVTLCGKVRSRSAPGTRPRTTSHPQRGPRPLGPVQGWDSSLWDDGNTGPPASPRKTEAS